MGKIGELREVDINLLKPYENNAKIHGEEQIELLMRSISEFGFLSPCLVERDTYNLIAGHGRVEAAKRLGMDAVPCVFVDDLTEEQRRAYILADNRLTELGEWDTLEGSRGKLFMTVCRAMLTQKQTQATAGGMTGVYLDNGTYVKSFYTVMCMPSAVTIEMMGPHRRMHHKIRWDFCVPQIISDKWRLKE